MRAFFVALITAGWVAAGAQTALRPPVQSTLVDGDVAYKVPPATGEGVLEEMSARAAVIFVGTVSAVRMPEQGGGVVEVEFAVSEAVRGAAAGAAYVVREWDGLWQDGARYRVGERRLMLLHAPGPGGLSSPVDGMDGAIPVAAGAVMAAAMAVGAGGVPVGEVLDMRWLEAKALRGAGSAAPVAARPGVVTVMGLLRGWEARRHAGR